MPAIPAARAPGGGASATWSAGRVVAVVAASLGALIALGLAIGGLVLCLAHLTLRDSDGYFMSPTETLRSAGHAVTAEGLDLGDVREGGAGWVVDDVSGVVRIRATSTAGDGVFVGIAPAAALDRYLAGVAHSEVTDGRDGSPLYREAAGERTPARPDAQDFWVARASGAGTQTAQWDPGSGEWGAVVMRQDGGANVTAEVAVGAKVDWLIWLGLALLGVGLVGLGACAIAIAITVRGVRGVPAGPPAPVMTTGAVGAVAAPAVRSHSPVHLEARLDEPLSRWLWIVKPILVIPHAIVLAFLWTAFAVLTVVAWFAILFTGRYPRGIFDFNVGVMRWSWRVAAYVGGTFSTDRYPPFSLAELPDYPATLEVPYPEHLSRGLALVKTWLLAIPHYLILAVFFGGVTLWVDEGFLQIGASTVLCAVAVIALLFTGRYPHEVFKLLVGMNRWLARTVAYAALMRDEYPPFRLED